MDLKETVLIDRHKKLGAKLCPFAGFNMPVEYESAKKETLAVRNDVGVFDVSHMGEFIIEGNEVNEFVDYLITNDYKNLNLNKAIYSPLCNHEGNILDDIIVYKLNEKRALVCVNAANLEKDWKWFEKEAKNFKVILTNSSNVTSLLALQGPNSEKILQKCHINTRDLSYYSAKELQFGDHIITVSRTGYTGEDGFEIFLPNYLAPELWDKFMELNVTPCGLAARDVLRTEVCYPLYGHELTEAWTPLDAGLRWTVKFNKENFIGKKALTNYVPKYQLLKLILEKGIPRPEFKVQNEKEEVVGIVSSGTYSVILEKGIALALIEKKFFSKDQKYYINMRGKPVRALLSENAFVNGGHI